MKNSTKRALRTGFQVVMAILLAIPALAASLPSWAVMTQVVVVAAGLSKGINALEDLGVIPSWLKDATPPSTTPRLYDAAP